MKRKIGTVELLAVRVYPLDAKNMAPDRTEVIVQPGVYDLFSDGYNRYWVMTGKVNLRGFSNVGNGMFMAVGHDEDGDIDVTFPSPRFSPKEWDELMTWPECQSGPHARLQVTFTT